jgi:chemotaxis protein methyltransferase CheR
MAALILDFEDFDAIRQLIYNASGIQLGDSKVIFLQVRLAERLNALGIATPREYYHYLKYDFDSVKELQRLVDAVTVNETWFFRETEPFNAWLTGIVPGLITQQPRIRIWSAGCSTGEEAYSLAMLISEAYPITATAQFEIVGTDISNRALDLARDASYDPHSLRHTDKRWIDRYMTPLGTNGSLGHRWAIQNKIKQLTRFQHGNLIDPALPLQIGKVDLILCRNVIIYFDEASRRATLANFHAALKPGGCLILGHAESLAHTTTPFELARVNGALLYRKSG